MCLIIPGEMRAEAAGADAAISLHAARATPLLTCVQDDQSVRVEERRGGASGRRGGFG